VNDSGTLVRRRPSYSKPIFELSRSRNNGSPTCESAGWHRLCVGGLRAKLSDFFPEYVQQGRCCGKRVRISIVYIIGTKAAGSVGAWLVDERFTIIDETNLMKFLTTVVFLALASVAAADTITIEGSLTTSDHLAEEDWRPGWPLGDWTFHYDVYNVISESADDITISATSPDFILWYGLWDEVVLPTDFWLIDTTGFNIYTLAIDSGAIDRDLVAVSTIAGPTPGNTYQFVIATWNYMPTDLGDYFLTLSSDSDFSVAEVPEPGTLVLLGIGLFGIGFARRRTALRRN